MAETPAGVEAYIAIKELDLLMEYETLMGWPLTLNPFWIVWILLARDTRAKVQISQGIREALSLIQRGQQESLASFWLLKQIAMDIMDSLGDTTTTPANTPVNSPANVEAIAPHPQ